MERTSKLHRLLVHVCALLLAILVLTPFVWLVVMSITPLQDLLDKPLRWTPTRVDFSSYILLLDVINSPPAQDFVSSLINSFLVVSTATVLAVLVGTAGGWAISRLKSLGWSLNVVIVLYMLPPVALAVPLYMVLARLGLLNSIIGLTLVYLAVLAPFATWLLKAGFDNLPPEIESAASLDGARLDQILRILSLPLTAPILATAAIFALLQGWDEFFYALLYTGDASSKTVTVAIAELSGGRVTNYGTIAAAGVIASLPPVVIGLIMQRALVSGLTSGGLKG